VTYATRAAVVAACFFVPAGGARAARLPDWARAIAGQAPAVPEGVPKFPIRILYRGIELEVLPSGAGLTVRERVAIQTLSARAGDASLRHFPFDDTAKIRSARGWSLSPGSHAAKGGQEPLEITVSGSFLTDRKSRMVVTDAVGRGALVFYEFEADETPHTLSWRTWLWEGAPIDKAVIEVKLPPDWDVKSAWLHMAGPAPAREGAIRRWTVEGLQPPEDEPLGDEPLDVAPILSLSFRPPAGQHTQRPAFSTWDDVAAWYTQLAGGRGAPSDAMRADAMAAIAAAGTEPIPRSLAAAKFVRDKVRYVARWVGIGGYQPHAAADCYRDRAGDCKDKANLLQTILALDGRPAYPVLINATHRDTVAEDVPDPQAFDHMVAGISVPAGAALPPGAVTVDAGELGRLLIVDTTDEFAPPGVLPYYLAGKTGLVVAGPKGHLVTLPEARAEDHETVTTLDAHVRPDRSVIASLTTLRRGYSAETARRATRESSKDREDEAWRALREAIPSAASKTYEVTLETDDGAFRESLHFEIPAPSRDNRAESLTFFPGALAALPKPALTRRTADVVFACPRVLRYAVTVDGTLADRVLSPGMQAAGHGWSVESSLKRDASAVHGSWQLTLSRTRFPQAEFPELKQLWLSATKAASVLVPLE
jgi:hypothetical protein